LPRVAAAPLPATGKSVAAERHPLASLLVPAALRARAMAYYRFARHADDIADHPALPAEEKLACLDALDLALQGRATSPAVEPAVAFRRAVAADPLLIEHATRLLHAFRRDAVQSFCHDWADLMAYCQFAAAPVGRFLLDLHGEAPDTFVAGDSLCAAVQVLNHLQDCGTDHRTLGRVYLPRDWMLMAGLTNRVFDGERCPAELRSVIDMVLDGVDGLIELARALPAQIDHRRLRVEAAVAVAAAQRLSELLRSHDPLASRVQLGPLELPAICLTGLYRGLMA
jgi:hydroxysqualene synthase